MTRATAIKRSVWVAVGGLAVLTAGSITAFARGEGFDERTIPVRTAPEWRGETRAELTAAPFVPAPIDRDHATRVVVDLEVIEKEMEIADGTTYRFWTFGGTMPGRFIRVREGDRVIFNLKNADDSEFPHNIDLHAVTGPGGGAAATIAVPGQAASFEFTALNPGLYVYHCAMPGMVGTHIANGMYGLILVEDAQNPLPPVDHEFYVMQGDFYTTGAFGEKGLQGFSYAKAVEERPDYVVFNGRVGALTGERSLQVRAGETVRLYVGNGGPNLSSSFHVIGEVFDNVYVEAGSRVNHNVQTTNIPAGGATIVDFRVDVPGDFHMVDHAIFRAGKGALGTITVSGDRVASIFQGADGAMAH
jgi:nitrite reductase (NO-forming)